MILANIYKSMAYCCMIQLLFINGKLHGWGGLILVIVLLLICNDFYSNETQLILVVIVVLILNHN